MSQATYGYHLGGQILVVIFDLLDVCSSVGQFFESWLMDHKKHARVCNVLGHVQKALVFFFFHSACLMSVCSGPAGRRIPNGILCWCSGIVLYLRR